MSDLITRMQKLEKEIQEKRKEYIEAAQKLLNEEFKRLFDENLDLKEFSWRQYTCYFNDGDELYFTVQCDTDYGLEVNGESPYDNNSLNDLGNKICKVISSVNDETLKDIYGDHALIIIKRDQKHQVESYTDHD